MSGLRWQRERLWFWSIIACVGLFVGGSSLLALQREVASKTHAYTNTPVAIRHSYVKLIEMFSTPTLMAIPGMKTKPARVRYANRAGQMPSRYVLEGELRCRNQSSKTVEALGLIIVPLDAFHQAVQTLGSERSSTHHVIARIPRQTEQRVTWEQEVGSPDVFEVAVVVTRVRFEDGTVWEAPEEELIDMF